MVRQLSEQAPRAAYYGQAWRRLRRQVLDRARWRCQACGRAGRLEVDHVTPIAEGGTDQPDNLQALCLPCHHHKTSTEHRSRRTLAPDVAPWVEFIDQTTHQERT